MPQTSKERNTTIFTLRSVAAPYFTLSKKRWWWSAVCWRPARCKRCHTAHQVSWFSFLPKTIFSSNVTTFSLARLGIRAVVNCTPNLPNHHEKLVINENPHEEKAINKNHHKEKTISYLRFPIGKWKANSGEDDNLLQTFLATFLQLNIFNTMNLPSIVSTINPSNRKTKNSS